MISHYVTLEFFRVQDEGPLGYLSALFCHRMHSNILGEHILFLISIFFKMSNHCTEGNFSKPSGQPVEICATSPPGSQSQVPPFLFGSGLPTPC